MRAKIHNLGLVGLVGLATIVAGCATVPPPTRLMDRAQAAIHAARAAGAATSAPEVLAKAERRLAAARQFTAKKDNGKATDSAEEAEAAAATARARARIAHLQQQIQAKTALNQRLEADLRRRQAAAAAAQKAAAAVPPAVAASAAPPASAMSAAPPATAASAAAPATAASAAGVAPVMLPQIQLGQPGVPASSAAGSPAPASTSGDAGAGRQP